MESSESEVRLWAAREGDETSIVLTRKVDYLRAVALEEQFKVSETKLDTLARCFLALEVDGIVLPLEKMKLCERLALQMAAGAAESQTLTVACVTQVQIRQLYRESQPL